MAGKPILGVIGGSGIYHMPFLTDTEELEITTPFGDPSSPILMGKIVGKKVAFIARHGAGHVLLPTEVNYRANVYALKSIGVRRIVSISACGSLREELSPGHIVIPDQLVDLTHKRQRSFFGEGIVAHVGSAEPFCRQMGNELQMALLPTGAHIHNGGAFITIEGPRFSTKAESNIYRLWGMSIIGMTASPEAFLAREAEICYATMAHVTDYDVWHSCEEPVTVEMVMDVLNKNTAIANQAIKNLVQHLPDDWDCDCQHALSHAIMTQREKIPADIVKKLGILVDKYL